MFRYNSKLWALAETTMNRGTVLRFGSGINAGRETSRICSQISDPHRTKIILLDIKGVIGNIMVLLPFQILPVGKEFYHG